MIGALSTAFDGLSTALSRFERNAAEIASPQRASLVEPQVDLVASRAAARANLAVARRADDSIGTLLDVLA